MIPIARPSIGEEEALAAANVIRSGLLASGEEVASFEREFASYIGTNQGIATSNGTTALHTALLALGIGPGDEVISSFTFIATATTLSMCNATPVIADVGADTYCIDPESVSELVTPYQKCRCASVRPYMKPVPFWRLLLIMDFFIGDCGVSGSEYMGRKQGPLACRLFLFYPTKT